MIKKFNQMMAVRYSCGVTLIELLIVLSLIAILSSISYPIYSSFLLKEHRIKAMETLIKLQLHIESAYFSAVGKSSTDKYEQLLESSINKHSGSCNIIRICKIDSNKYTLSYQNGISGYVLFAIPKKGSNQTNDKCGILSLDSAGNSNASRAGCW